MTRTIQERTRRRVIITFHRANELTTTFELTTARHLFSVAASTPRTSIIPSILKTSPKSKNKEKKKPMLSPGKGLFNPIEIRIELRVKSEALMQGARELTEGKATSDSAQ